MRRSEGEKLVLSEFSGQMISIESEAWRHECEVAFLVGLPDAMRDEMIDGLPGTGRAHEHGIAASRGEGVAAMLRAEIERLREIRRRRMQPR